MLRMHWGCPTGRVDSSSVRRGQGVRLVCIGLPLLLRTIHLRDSIQFLLGCLIRAHTLGTYLGHIGLPLGGLRNNSILRSLLCSLLVAHLWSGERQVQTVSGLPRDSGPNDLGGALWLHPVHPVLGERVPRNGGIYCPLGVGTICTSSLIQLLLRGTTGMPWSL